MTSAEITTILASLTHILDNQEKQNKERDERIKSLLDTQKTLTNKLSQIAPTPSLKKPPTTSPPPHLHSNCTLREFNNWKIKYKDYCLLNSVEKLTLEEQKAVFRALLDDEWLRVLQFVIQCEFEDDDVTTEDVIEEMQTHLRSQRNIVLDRKEFYSRNQQSGESFDDYYMCLQEIASFCNFCENCIDDQYRDRIITGIHDEETVRELLTEKDLTLDKAVSICRARENANKDNEALQEANGIAKISSYKREKMKASKSNEKVYTCSFCGNEWHEKLVNCPARGKWCRACGEKDHFPNSRRCKGAAAQPEYESANKKPQRKRQLYSLTINDISGKKQGKKSPKVNIGITYNNKSIQVSATPDSGAEVSTIPVNVAKRLGVDINNLKPSRNRLYAANKKELSCMGTFEARLQLGEKYVDVELNVVKEIQSFLLSWYHAIDLAILPTCFPQQIKEVKQVTKHKAENEKARGLIQDRKPPAIPENYSPSPKECKKHMEEMKAAFPTVFSSSSTLKPMKGGAMKIPIKEDATPFSISTPRTIPYGWREKAKQKIDEMVQKEIIVEVTEPTKWCHPMVIQPKKESEDLRICVCLKKLNEHVKRATYPTTNPYDAVSSIPRGANYFTTLDAVTGYWQIPISPEDQELTTFITPWGRYKFLRAPMGLISSGDEYNKRGDQALSQLENTVKVVDDILVHDVDYKSHIENVWAVLKKCEENDITLNPDKFKFAQEETEYCGYILNKNGYTVDHKKVNAITEFKTPTCKTDLRSFMGLANQLGEFSTDIAKTAEPLRHLLKKDSEWIWTPNHEQAFKDVKEALINPPVIAHFDPRLPIMLQTDASRLNGLGYILQQKHKDGWKMVKCGSRFLSETESRYATIEQELLAVTWATKKCDNFLRGTHHFDIITDHRPLLQILNTKCLSEIENPRLQRLREKLSSYSFTAIWKRGKEHTIPDALSRSPVERPTKADEEAESEIQEDICEVINIAIQEISTAEGRNENDQLIKLISESAKSDPNYRHLRESIIKGLPENKNEWDLANRSYFNVRNSLTVDRELILCGNRIVIPEKLRKEMLERLHSSHQGIERTKRRARTSMYWPNIDNDISNKCKCCSKCQKYLPSNQREPILHDDIPERVFQNVSSDLFEYAGKQYLIYVDKLSGYPIVNAFEHEATARKVISALRNIFSMTGAPEIFRCDNGPQYGAKRFKDFLKKWNVEAKPSTPYYPQSNGLAEATVKTVKHLLAKCSETGDLDSDEFALGLLELRNTPRVDGRSSAQILFGHQLRSNIPVHHSGFAKVHQDKMDECDRRKIVALNKGDRRYNATAKELPSFSIGNHVNIQNNRSGLWDKNGVIVGIGRHRDYLIKLGSGRVYWRNRRYLRTHHTPVPSTPSPEVSTHSSPGTTPEPIPTEEQTPEANTPTRPPLPEPTRETESVIQTRGHNQDENYRRSARHSVKPKRLILDPTAHSYGEGTYEDFNDEDRSSS